MQCALPIPSSCPKTLPAQAGAEGLLGLGQRPMDFFHRSCNLLPCAMCVFSASWDSSCAHSASEIQPAAARNTSVAHGDPKPSAYSAQRLAMRMTPF
jgi:hypothetical protein